jgi:hypothetical protein
VHRTQSYTEQLSKSECISSLPCDNSKLSITSNFHEHDFPYTAESNIADIAQLAQWIVNGTDDFELIKLSQTLIFFDIISLAQRTVIPTSCLSWSTTFIIRRLEPERFAEKKKGGRNIEQYKILLEWKWQIQALLRISTEKMHQSR